MAGTRGINGVGVGVAGVGVVLVYAGIRRVTLLEAFKALAMGKAPTPNPRKPWTDVAFQAGQAAAGGGLDFAAGSILQTARQVADSPAGRQPYCWGGGHTGSPCSAKCFDCSGYVSCVLGKLGVMTGSMVTTQFLVWKGATTVSFDQRQPGDLWVSATHMGIIVDDRQILNAACTGCGPVKLSPYKRDSRYVVRRIKLPGTGRAPAGSGVI